MHFLSRLNIFIFIFICNTKNFVSQLKKFYLIEVNYKLEDYYIKGV
jgi:hypothetical protein